MKNIKKKLLSLGLTAAMVACYTPATIFADEVGNQGNVSNKCWNISKCTTEYNSNYDCYYKYNIVSTLKL